MELTQITVTDADRADLAGRNRAIDPAALDGLHFLGAYRREIPSNLTRMMENAYDWEHLPFVHPSSFAAIAPVETGTWGWRCKTALPNGAGTQLIELLVDEPRHYWATTVVEGAGKGTQIHTQASARPNGGIAVDVRFYLPQAPESEQQAAMILAYLQAQYATLYDEDETLMRGRQDALDERKARRGSTAGVEDIAAVDMGPEAALDRGRVHEGMSGANRVLVRYAGGAWRAHAARCPHALAPLDTATGDDQGTITCPWHGYRFDLTSGVESRGRCGALAIYQTAIEDGRLVVRGANGTV